MRHGFTDCYDPKPGASIATLAYEYPRDFHVSEHAHGSDQVIYATRGVMEVSAGQSLWLIPPQFAMWIPARTMHRLRMPGVVSMRTLYLRPGIAAKLPATCTVLHVTPLLRELIVEAVRIGELRTRNRLHRVLRDLIVFQIESASPVPISLTLPTDPRALAVAQALLDNQTDNPSLHSLCAAAGASVRTIERVFRKEVGADFATWRRQARLMKAVELLAAGHLVKQAAFATGYRQPSAFVEMFRKTFAVTPKAWAAALAERRPSAVYRSAVTGIVNATVFTTPKRWN
ncbi:MAG: AraC family transcriptional regulator [Bryobacteraceae bacterium]